MTPIRRAACAAVLALLAAGCGRAGNDSSGGAASSGSASASPGVSASEIRIGGDAPLTGPIAGYGVDAQAAAAYFKYVNNHDGGVKMADGVRRRIKFTFYDDAYQPDRALQNAQRLVQQDKVFAMFGVVGTPPSEAMRPYLNQNKVPQAFTLSSTTAIGADDGQDPWTIGWPLAFATEAGIEAQYIKHAKPDAKVGILYVDNDGGRDLLAGFKKAIAGSGVKIVDAESYEPTDAAIGSQMSKLANSGADVFYDISTSKYTAQAIDGASKLGWHPLHILDSVGANATVLQQAGAAESEGVRSVTFLKDPSDPRWANDPDGIGLYRQVIAKYGSGITPDDTLAVLGVAAAESLVEVLEQSQPNRASFMAALRNLKGVTTPLFLPGVSMTTSQTDPFPVESAALEVFSKGSWRAAQKAISYEGNTPR